MNTMKRMKTLFNKANQNATRTNGNQEQTASDDSLKLELEKIDELKLHFQKKNDLIMMKMNESVENKKALLLIEKKLSSAETQLTKIRQELSDKSKQVAARDNELADVKKLNKNLTSELTDKSKNFAKIEKTLKIKNDELDTVKTKLKQQERKMKEIILTHKSEIQQKDKRIKDLEKNTQKSKTLNKTNRSQINNSNVTHEKTSIEISTSNESVLSIEALPTKEVFEKTKEGNGTGDSPQNKEKTNVMNGIDEKQGKNLIGDARLNQLSKSNANLKQELERKSKLLIECQNKLGRLEVKGVGKKVVTVADTRNIILMKDEEIIHWKAIYETCKKENEELELKEYEIRNKYSTLIQMYRRMYMENKLYRMQISEQKNQIEAYLSVNTSEENLYVQLKHAKKQISKLNRTIQVTEKKLTISNDQLNTLKMKNLKSKSKSTKQNAEVTDLVPYESDSKYKICPKDLYIFKLQELLLKHQEKIRDGDDKLIACRLELAHYKLWTKKAITFTMLYMPDWINLYQKMCPETFEKIRTNENI